MDYILDMKMNYFYRGIFLIWYSKLKFTPLKLSREMIVNIYFELKIKGNKIDWFKVDIYWGIMSSAMTMRANFLKEK